MSTHAYRQGYRARRDPDPARAAALAVLGDVADGAYANLALPRELARRRSEGPRFDDRDAAFASELVYGTLRQRGRLDFALSACVDRPLDRLDPVVLDLLRLGAYQILDMRVPDHAAVAATVDLARAATSAGPAGLVNAVLRAVARVPGAEWERRIDAIPDLDERLAARWSHPAWIVRALQDALPAHGLPAGELEPALEADNAHPYVTLVARPGLIAPGDLADEAEDLLDTRVAPGEVSPLAVVVESGDPGRLPSVRAGRSAVEDEGSQLAAQVLAAAPLEGPDRAWLDLCAGPGGKAALLGALGAERGARLVANEVVPARAELVAKTARGLDNVQVTCEDGRTFGAQRHAPRGPFDRILVDAPCTGLGALRRRPEARWRRRPEDLADLTALQADLLERAIELARPGGVIAYVTCSPHVAETLGQVNRAVARGGVQLLDAVATAGLIAPAELGLPKHAGTALQLWPHRQGTDAMFVALLRRQGA